MEIHFKFPEHSLSDEDVNVVYLLDSSCQRVVEHDVAQVSSVDKRGLSSLLLYLHSRCKDEQDCPQLRVVSSTATERSEPQHDLPVGGAGGGGEADGDIYK